MKGYIIAGATGTGKTTYIKSLLQRIPNKKSIIIYDVQNEYSEFYKDKFVDFELFIERVALYITDAVIVLEEATIFANNRLTNKHLQSLLVSKRHSNNYIILVYHSLRTIPRYVYDLCNYMTVFKTNDTPSFIARKFEDERIEVLMEEIRQSADNHIFRTLKIY